MPLILGVVAAGPVLAHALLAMAALSAYLCSVPAIDWLRTRRPELRPPAVLFGAATVAAGVPLVVTYPAILPIVGVAAVAAVVALWLTLAGRATSVLVSLVQVAQAIALVPAAAVITGTLATPAAGRATLAASLYLIGSVLVVRSLIRERGNAAWLAASIAFHALAILAAAVVLPWPYVVLAVGLLGRAIGLPLLQRRLDAGPRRLRPIHIGIVEIVASVALIALALLVGF